MTGRHLAAVQFAISAAALLAVVATVGLYSLHRAARDEALREATTLTRMLADSVLGPALDAPALAADPAALARVDRAFRTTGLSDLVVRVKVWTPQGRVVWSDEPRLVGTGTAVPDDVAAVASTGQPLADLSDLSERENGFERGNGDLLEVYVPVTAADGTPLVAETYQRTAALAAASDAIWRRFVPVLLLALLALAVAQVPLARWYRLRARREEAARAELTARAEHARRDERSQIAADLHDGVVQDLAATAFDLSATAATVHRRTPEDLAEAMRRGAESARSSIEQLRALLVRLYPADQPVLDLADALPELAADLKRRGVRVDLRVARVTMEQQHSALLYRAAQEALRNVARHAAATRATISLSEADGVATLLIEDDGHGMTSRDLVRQRAAGHVGLTLLADRVRAQRGELTISSEPGRGTRLTVWLPVQASAGPG